MISAAEPVRTCIGCRTREPMSNLQRLVVDHGSTPVIVIDHDRRAPGRGAWIHPSAKCWRRAEKTKAMSRALKVPQSVGLDPSARPSESG